jgi:hypothetical protein
MSDKPENQMEEIENEEESLSEEQTIFKEILETNSKKYECEQNGNYIEAGRLKEYLIQLGKLYQAKCMSALDERQRWFN